MEQYPEKKKKLRKTQLNSAKTTDVWNAYRSAEMQRSGASPVG